MYTNNYKILAETISKALAPISESYLKSSKESFDALNSKIKELRDVMMSMYSLEHFKELSLQISELCKTALSKIEPPTIPPNAFISLSSIDLHNNCIEINDENVGQFSYIVDNGAIAMKTLGEANIEQKENNYIDLPKSLSDLVMSIDSSLELPKPDAKNVIHVKESSGSTNFWNIISALLSIIGIFVSVYIAYSASISSSQQHSELMQEEQKQTIELQKQTDQLIQFNKTMEQLLETISHNSENSDIDDESFMETKSQ